jgi:dTDP-4-amino-4,6-dideoxygalactose transaminase
LANYKKQIAIEIPFLRSEFPATLLESIGEVIETGYVGSGPKVAELERAISRYLSVNEIVCTSSGTAALTLAYAACGITKGRRVLTTPMTCAATNIPLLHLGAEVFWIDIDPKTGCVQSEYLKDTIKMISDITAIVVMDWAGNPCDYSTLHPIANEAGAILIADSAQAFGSSFNGEMLGNCADITCFSFGPTKMLSTIEGGAVVFAESSLQNIMRKLSWHGIDRNARDPLKFWEYEIDIPGFRFTSNDIFASIGIEMINTLPSKLHFQRKIASLYEENLRQVHGLKILEKNSCSQPNYWMFTILAEQRNNLLRKLHEQGIHAALPHKRNDKINCFKDCKTIGQLTGVDEFSSKYLCLPIGQWITEDDCLRVCKVIRDGW